MSKNPSPAKSTAKDELSLDDLEKIAGGTGAAPSELSLTSEQDKALGNNFARLDSFEVLPSKDDGDQFSSFP